MISLRYHVVSLAAAFLALALGVLLGSTSVSERLLTTVSGERASLSKKVDELEGDRTRRAAELAAANRFNEAVGPLAVDGQLAQRSVVLIATADSDPRQRNAIRELLGSAGATVNGELHLTDSFSNPHRADRLRQVVTRLLPAGVQLPGGTDSGSLAGGVLGPVALADPRTGQPQATEGERASVLSGLTDGGFVTVAQPVNPAELAVVITGGVDGVDAENRAAALARFATQVDRSGAGAVLAGPRGSAGGKGAVGVVRADSSMSSVLSTVDNVDSAGGRIATVLALREQWDRRSGHYGLAGGADGPAPSVRG